MVPERRKTLMTVIYRDEIGIVSVTMADDDLGRTIDFCDGFAFFTAGDQDYRIPISALVQIQQPIQGRKEQTCGLKE